MEFFASVFLKSWTSVTAAVILTSTTPALSLLSALRSLKLPEILVAVVLLMYRYLFVLVEEASENAPGSLRPQCDNRAELGRLPDLAC